MAAVGDSPKSALTAVGQEVGTMRFEEPDYASSNWYFSREEIEKNSPSRKDGIDAKKEAYFRRSYCTFCQDVGMRLRVPQLTIATAIVFCHRFFLRQSHKLNDRFMIATICMFLAGKVEETPRPLRDVIHICYEVRHKKDPAALQKIKQQKEVFEQQRELVLVGERLVLQTLGFDLNIHHPYKPLIAAVKKLGTAQSLLAQVAWNFVNDGLRTSLCLQFKPHHIAAGAIFLAAKFLKVKLPSEGDRTWWQEFGVTPRQLEEVSNQMLELYEQQGSAGGGGESKSSDPPGGPSGPHRDALKDKVGGIAANPQPQSQPTHQPSQQQYAQQPQPPPPPPPPLLQPPQATTQPAPQVKVDSQQQPRSPPRPRHKMANGRPRSPPGISSDVRRSPLLQLQDGKPARASSPAVRVQTEVAEAAREHRNSPKLGGVGCTPPGALLPPTSNGNNLVDSGKVPERSREVDRSREIDRSRTPLPNGGVERGSPPRERDARRWKSYKRPDEEVLVRRDSEDGQLPEGSPQLPRGKAHVDGERVMKAQGERVEVDNVGERGQVCVEERGEVENRIDPASEDERNERECEENEEEMWELIEQVEVNDGPKKGKSKKNPDKRRLSGVAKSKELLEMVSPRRRRVSGIELKKEDEEEGEIGGKRRMEEAEDMKKEKASPRIESVEKRKLADAPEGREREKVEDGELPSLAAAKERRGGTASASDGSPSRLSPSDASGRSRERGYHSNNRYDRHYYGRESRDHYHRHGGGHGSSGGAGLAGAGSGYRYRHNEGVDRDRGERHRHRDREWPGDVEDHRHKKGRYEH